MPKAGPCDRCRSPYAIVTWWPDRLVCQRCASELQAGAPWKRPRTTPRPTPIEGQASIFDGVSPISGLPLPF